jgi:2-C-methyl-D-erythritol 4-phosphate cytidylyltransferase
VAKLLLIVVTEKTPDVQTTVPASAYIRMQARRGARRRVRSVGAAQPNFREGGANEMATYRDPVRVFAPLEIIERLLEIRAEAGYMPAIFMHETDDLVAYFDAYGFDVYSFANAEAEFRYGKYRAPLAPGGDHAHVSATAH